MTTKEEVGLVVAGMGIWYAIRRRPEQARRSPVRGPRLRARDQGRRCRTTTTARLVVLRALRRGRRLGRRDREDARSPTPGRSSSRRFRAATSTTCCTCSLPLSFLFVSRPARPRRGRARSSRSTSSRRRRRRRRSTSTTPRPRSRRSSPRRCSARRWLARRFPARTGAIVACAVVVAVVANWKLGAVPLWSGVPGGEDFQANDWRVTAHDRIADRALGSCRGTAVVSATNVLGAHLSDRGARCSACRSSATRPGSSPTRRARATPTGSRRCPPRPRSSVCARARTGSSSSSEDGVLVFHKRKRVEHNQHEVPGEQRPDLRADRPERVVVEVPGLRERERGDEQRARGDAAERNERDQPDEVLRREHLREREEAGDARCEREPAGQRGAAAADAGASAATTASTAETAANASGRPARQVARHRRSGARRRARGTTRAGRRRGAGSRPGSRCGGRGRSASGRCPTPRPGRARTRERRARRAAMRRTPSGPVTAPALAPQPDERDRHEQQRRTASPPPPRRAAPSASFGRSPDESRHRGDGQERRPRVVGVQRHRPERDRREREEERRGPERRGREPLRCQHVDDAPDRPRRSTPSSAP